MLKVNKVKRWGSTGSEFLQMTNGKKLLNKLLRQNIILVSS